MASRLFARNEHKVERVLRVVLGLGLLSIVFVGPRTYWGLIGVVPLATGQTLRLVTNDLTAPAEHIARLYKDRWAIELFFRWLKQNPDRGELASKQLYNHPDYRFYDERD